MILKSLPFAQTRAAALRTGALLNITAAANAADIMMPSAISPRLWRIVAGEDPFLPQDPRAICLCWCVFLMLKAETYTREHVGPRHRAVWFEAKVLGRTAAVKAIAHPGDHGEPVMTLLAPDEADPFSV
jgi:hypothetical protein